MNQLIVTLAFYAIPLIIIGLLAIGGYRLAKHVEKSLPLTYVSLHILLMCLALMPYFFGKGFPDIPYDAVYIPFIFYPGGIFHTPAWAAGAYLWPNILEYMSHEAGSRVCIFYVPGIMDLILGSGMWYVVGVLAPFRTKKSADQSL